MESSIASLTLILLVAAMVVITITGVVIYNLKRQQPTQRKGVDGIQPTVIAEKQVAPQEPQSPVSEETELTVQEKRPPIRAGEIQAIAKEEAKTIVAEETEPAVPELPQKQETVKVQPEGAVEEKRGQREPIKRGGKPRGPTQDREKRTQGIQHRHSKPEIVCWKRERQWILAVEMPEKLLEKPVLTVLQNESPLEQDESEVACWRLKGVTGEVIVRWNEDEEDKIDLGHEDYLLFKLSGQDLNQGRRVKSPSSGSYLVIVPNDWRRDETLAGPPPVTPEPTSLPDYRAHFFDLEKGGREKIAFRHPDKPQLVVIEPKAPRFDLLGNRIEDASEYMGPLFGEGPPRIRDIQAWENVETIVIGEEGRGRRRWRTAFQPDPEKSEQDLPLESADRKSGWYFLRFYTADGDLAESMDFRFVSVLKEIRVPQLSPIPAGDGHKKVCVEFLHEPSCTVEPKSGSENIQVERHDDKTVLIVSPDAGCDESQWLVGPEGASQVEVTINVERIWWAIGEEDTEPSDWQDRPVILDREDFKATSSKALWLRLPKPRWVDKVLVGFERSKARPYDVRVTEKTVVIPLREYSDYAEVGDQTQQHSLKLWINRDHEDMEGVLAVIPASPITVRPVPDEAVPIPTESCVGLGRKKAAIAKAVMQRGAEEIKINGQPIDEYFRKAPHKGRRFLERLLDLGEVRWALSQMEVNITVEGSSPTTMRQPKAVAHALARALMDYDPRLTPLLRQAGFGGAKVKASKTRRRGKR